MDYIDPRGFRANVCIVLQHQDGRVFLGRRVGGRGWQFPQGGVKHGETPEQALFRELYEEIGLQRDAVEVVGSTRRWLHYRLPERLIRRDERPLCIGQKQRWFLLRPRESEPRFRFDCGEIAEFEHFRWADFWDPVREVVPFKRSVYRLGLQELGAIAFGSQLPVYPDWWAGLMGASGSRLGAPRGRGRRRRRSAPDVAAVAR